VVNPGTSDFLAAWRAHRDRAAPSVACDAASCSPDAAAFQAAYAQMLRDLRRAYADAHIICTTGPMLSDVEPAQAAQHATLERYVGAAATALADSNVSTLDFGVQDPSEPTGCEGHPSAATHRRMAMALEAHIRGIAGW
jgi:lysophospholipase L1-like esterase